MWTIFFKNFKKYNIYILYYIIFIYISTYINNIFIYLYLFIFIYTIYFVFFEKKYNYNVYIYIVVFCFLTISIDLFFFFFKNINNYSFNLQSNSFFLKKNIGIHLCIDTYSCHFLILTGILGSFILLYSVDYMKFDFYKNRFSLLLVLFILSMFLLLMSYNYLALILGWEMIGITSFFLINFWFTKTATNKASYKAFIFNKLSDVGIICFCIFLLLTNEGKLFSKNFFGFYEYTQYHSYFFFFLLMISSFCKSAQIGFHVWLPDSMEAPIPASALIHSATLVSAGIFICGRYSNVYSILFTNFKLIPAMTAFYGAIVASCQTDVKKILAYSTISHCGYLFYLVFTLNQEILVIYLYIHGFFKALSFTTIGLMLTKTTIYQDFRKFGGIESKNSFEFYVLPIVLLNLAGLPLFLGFFSKYFFIETIVHQNITFIAYILFQISSFCGFIYAIQIIYNLYFCSKKTVINASNLHNSRTNKIYYFFICLAVLLGLFSLLFFYKMQYLSINNMALASQNKYNTSTVLMFYKLYPLLVLIFFKKINHVYIVMVLGLLSYVFL